MTPIAAWLKDARTSQTNPDTGRPWSQAYLAERVTAETGWKLYRETYVGYERGAGMQPETLQRFVDFWQGYGIEAPDLTEKPAPLSLEERAVAAAERQAAAAERQAAAMELHVMLLARQTVATEALAGRQAPAAPDLASAEEAVLAWGRAALARTQSLAPEPAFPAEG